MANTLILVDRRNDPWKKVNVTLKWRGGGYDHAQTDDSGRAQFGGSGLIEEVQAAGETMRIYQEVNGSTTFVAQSQNSH